MKAPEHFEGVVGGKRYSVATAMLLAGDDYWDGNNYERRGRQTFLYKTQRGNYFLLKLTQWQGERDRIEPLTTDEAVEMWELLPEHRMAFELAFPDYELLDA